MPRWPRKQTEEKISLKPSVCKTCWLRADSLKSESIPFFPLAEASFSEDFKWKSLASWTLNCSGPFFHLVKPVSTKADFDFFPLVVSVSCALLTCKQSKVRHPFLYHNGAMSIHWTIEHDKNDFQFLENYTRMMVEMAQEEQVSRQRVHTQFGCSSV